MIFDERTAVVQSSVATQILAGISPTIMDGLIAGLVSASNGGKSALRCSPNSMTMPNARPARPIEMAHQK